MYTLLSIVFYYGPLCVPYTLFCFTMEQHVYPTLYFVLFWAIMCTLPSILFYNGLTCIPYSQLCFIMDHYVYPTLYFGP
jgi:hypothetical protein